MCVYNLTLFPERVDIFPEKVDIFLKVILSKSLNYEDFFVSLYSKKC